MLHGPATKTMQRFRFQHECSTEKVRNEADETHVQLTQKREPRAGEIV